MALIGHWPLIGNTDDISGNGYTLTNLGSTNLSVNGKIGLSADLDGVNDYLYYNGYTLANSTPFTMACWIKTRYIPTVQVGIMSFGYYPVTVLLPDGRIRTWWYNGSNYPQVISTAALNDNLWHHILTTYNGNDVKLYIDGLLVDSINSPTVIAHSGIYLGIERNVENRLFQGQLNDARFYDHALSLKEIKELAKAKVLDYSFNTFQEPTQNLLVNTLFETTNNWSKSSNGAGTFSVANNYGTLTVPSGSYYTYLRQTTTVNTVAADTYTLSFKVKDTAAGKFSLRIVYYGITTYEQSTVFTLTGSGKEFVYSKTFTTNTSNTMILSDIMIGNYYGELGGVSVLSIDFTMAQLEKKSYATPFTIGTRTGIVLDNSPYRNNGSLDLASTPKWISADSRLGSGAYSFNGATNYITIPNSIAPKPTTEMTISFWMKTNNVSRRWEWLISKNNDSGANTGYMITKHSDLSKYVFSVDGIAAGSAISNFSTGTWYHIVGTVRANDLIKFYVNGNLIESKPFTYSLITHNDIDLGINKAFYYASPSAFDGIIDDIKIYATALSDNDILELYNTRASIDKNGNLWTDEIVEDIEIQDGLTLASLFETNKTNLSGNTWVANPGHTLSNVTASSLTQTMNIGIGAVSFYVEPSFADTNIYYYWFEFKTADVSPLASYPHSRYFETGSYQNFDAKNLYENNKWKRTSRVGAANQRLHIQTHYITATTQNYVNYYRDMSKINLTSVFGAGLEPSLAQMDEWYDLYIRARVLENGTTHAQEFIEDDTITESSKFFKDKIKVKGSIMEV